MKALEKEIKAIIREVTCCEYIGKLKVIKEEMNDSYLYMLLLYLDKEMTPIVLGHEGTEEEFKNFVRKELKARKLQIVKSWKGIQELPDYNKDYE